MARRRRRFGEIKRSQAKVRAQYLRIHRGRRDHKGPSIYTTVERGLRGRYGARACVSFPGRGRSGMSPGRCAYGEGATPSAALVKAVKGVTTKFRHFKSVRS